MKLLTLAEKDNAEATEAVKLNRVEAKSAAQAVVLT